MLEVGDRLGGLLLTEQQPRPLELGRGRGRAPPGRPRHLREQGERRPLLYGVQPDRNPARQQQDIGPASPPSTRRSQTSSRKPQGLHGAARTPAGNEQQRAPQLGKAIPRKRLPRGPPP